MRSTTTLATLLVVGAVVAVLTWMLGLAGALRHSLSTASDAQKLLVLKRGATAESNSSIAVDEFNKLSQVMGVSRDSSTGEALVSPEMLVQVSLPRAKDGGTTFANIAVRGVTDKATQVHRNVKLLGRMFSPATQEVIVGLSAAKQFLGLNIGDTIQLGYGGDRGYLVVGYFLADGGPMESEIWGYLPSLMNSHNRTTYSSAGILLNSTADPQTAIEQIEGPAIQLSAVTESEYWERQAGNIRNYLNIAYVLVGIMSIAAAFSIANTLFSSVAGRTKEIAMLKTIGFSRASVLTGFVVEAVILALLGGVFGCLLCFGWLALVGNTKDMFGAATFTVMAFEIRLNPVIIGGSLLLVTVVAVIGAFFPARRASRLEIVTALREA